MKHHGATRCLRAIVWWMPAIGLASAAGPAAAIHQGQCASFTVEQMVTLPGAPETIYDAITGDITGWWDHSFSKPPKRLYIEAKPGGGFWEQFDDAGNGVRHATVIYAHRGKLLRFEGPLGLSGNAITMVTTYAFTPVGADSTRLEVTAHCAGEYQDSWPALVDRTWHHFIVERFKPYIESGKHKKK